MNLHSKYIYFFLAVVLILQSCGVRVSKNIVYNKEHQLSLNIFAPKDSKKPSEVLVFMHGGSWARGKKSTYNFLGKRLARKGVVAVIIDYRLVPKASYEGIAMDVASATKWTKENIDAYGGDPQRIFLSGHSAGGQLAALVGMQDRFFDSLKIKNPVKGVILIDAFGLDMYTFLNESNYNRATYLSVFSKDTVAWKKGSPYYGLHKDMPPFLMFVGGRTNGNIIRSNAKFYESLKKYQPAAQLITVKRTAHVGMVFRLYNSRKETYGYMINFMRAGNKKDEPSDSSSSK